MVQDDSFRDYGADANAVAAAVDRFQNEQPNAQVRRADIKRMLAALAVNSPDDPDAFLDELVADAQSNERSPWWDENGELKLSTASAGAPSGWAGSLAGWRPSKSPDKDRESALHAAGLQVPVESPDVVASVRLERLLIEQAAERTRAEEEEQAAAATKIAAASRGKKDRARVEQLKAERQAAAEVAAAAAPPPPQGSTKVFESDGKTWTWLDGKGWQ